MCSPFTIAVRPSLYGTWCDFFGISFEVYILKHLIKILFECFFFVFFFWCSAYIEDHIEDHLDSFDIILQKVQRCSMFLTALGGPAGPYGFCRAAGGENPMRWWRSAARRWQNIEMNSEMDRQPVQ